MHDSGPVHSIIGTIAVALEDPFKISKESFGSFPFTPKPEGSKSPHGWRLKLFPNLPYKESFVDSCVPGYEICIPALGCILERF